MASLLIHIQTEQNWGPGVICPAVAFMVIVKTLTDFHLSHLLLIYQLMYKINKEQINTNKNAIQNVSFIFIFCSID